MRSHVHSKWALRCVHFKTCIMYYDDVISYSFVNCIGATQFNTLRPIQNGCNLADDTFKAISLKFVPKGPINNISALVQIMACCRPGDKPLSEPMMVRLPKHICITRPQWVDSLTHLGLKKWQTFCRQYFQMYLHERKYLYFHSNFIEVWICLLIDNFWHH